MGRLGLAHGLRGRRGVGPADGSYARPPAGEPLGPVCGRLPRSGRPSRWDRSDAPRYTRSPGSRWSGPVRRCGWSSPGHRGRGTGARWALWARTSRRRQATRPGRSSWCVRSSRTCMPTRRKGREHDRPVGLHAVTGRETLWSVAEDHLGSARRWREIAELNYGVPQSDGGSLRRFALDPPRLGAPPAVTDGRRHHGCGDDGSWGTGRAADDATPRPTDAAGDEGTGSVVSRPGDAARSGAAAGSDALPAPTATSASASTATARGLRGVPVMPLGRGDRGRRCRRSGRPAPPGAAAPSGGRRADSHARSGPAPVRAAAAGSGTEPPTWMPSRPRSSSWSTACPDGRGRTA